MHAGVNRRGNFRRAVCSWWRTWEIRVVGFADRRMEGTGYRPSAQFYPSPGSTAVNAAALHNYPSKWDLLRFQQVYGGSSTGGKETFTFSPSTQSVSW